MMMTRGSKTQRKSHAASSATARRAGRGHGIERASLVYRSAGISGLALGLACFFAMSAQVCAQTMSGSTMTVPGTAYPPSAGSPAASMGAPPVVPVDSRSPHLVHVQSAGRQPHQSLGQAQGVADRQAAIARRGGDSVGDQKAGAHARRSRHCGPSMEPDQRGARGKHLQRRVHERPGMRTRAASA